VALEPAAWIVIVLTGLTTSAFSGSSFFPQAVVKTARLINKKISPTTVKKRRPERHPRKAN